MAIYTNNRSNATVRGSGGDDNVYNSGAYTNITLSNGNNTVDNTGAHVIINTGSGNDAITNRSNSAATSYITINSGAGDDTVLSRSSYSSVSAGAGDDIISLTGGVRNSIDGGAGNDTIVAHTGKSIIEGGNGDDSIVSYSASNTLAGGKGNDVMTGSIFNETFVYTNGDGDDTITKVASNDFVKINLRKRVQRRVIGNKLTIETVSSDLGEDLETIMSNVSLRGSDLVIKVGSGSLTIENALGTPVKLIDDHLKTAIINPNDYINNNIDDNTLQGSPGNDYIQNGYDGGFNNGDEVTISAGTGKDTINNKGDSVYIDAGEGNDIINNYGSDTTIIGAAGRDTIKLQQARSSVLGGDDSDYISNNYKGVGAYLSGGNDSDTILNTAATVAIYGDDGDDYLYNGSGGHSSTISGGAGNDTIRSMGQNVSISGGDGDDLIYTAAAGVTLTGGKGDDTLRLGDAVNLINYTAGDGNDTIFGYKSGDTLNLINATVTSTENDGADVILEITGNDGSIGSINLKSSKYRKLTLTTETDTVSNTFDATYPEGITPDKAKTSVNVNQPFNGTFDLNDYVNIKNVDARDSDSTVMVIANHRGNRFYASSSGGTLAGGQANDFLYCNTGADKYIYALGGNDVIFNFDEASDSIEFSSEVSVNRVAISGNDVVLYFDKTKSLKIKNAKGKALSITDDSGTTSTYTFTTSYTGSLVDNQSAANFVERSFFEEFKFSEEYNLEEIITEGDINGKQSICIPGTTRERKINNDLTTNEHGSALHSNVHNKVFR